MLVLSSFSRSNRRTFLIALLGAVTSLNPSPVLGYEVAVGFEGNRVPGNRYYAEKGFYFSSQNQTLTLAVGVTNPPFTPLPFPISGTQYVRFASTELGFLFQYLGKNVLIGPRRFGRVFCFRSISF